MLVITIKSGNATARDVRTKNGMRRFFEQFGFIELDDEVRKVRVPVDVEAGQAPYAPGKYTVSASSYGVGRFGDLQINPFELSLEPLVEAAPAARSVAKAV